jgi:hypothetical protein
MTKITPYPDTPWADNPDMSTVTPPKTVTVE